MQESWRSWKIWTLVCFTTFEIYVYVIESCLAFILTTSYQDVARWIHSSKTFNFITNLQNLVNKMTTSYSFHFIGNFPIFSRMAITKIKLMEQTEVLKKNSFISLVYATYLTACIPAQHVIATTVLFYSHMALWTFLWKAIKRIQSNVVWEGQVNFCANIVNDRLSV